MIHYVYVGHFARQGDFIAFQKQADGSLRPVVTRALSMEMIQQVLHQRGLTVNSLPEEWGLWLDDGFIVCDRFTHSREAIDVVRRLATETACDIADYSSQSLMVPEELSFAWEPQVQSQDGITHGNLAEQAAAADRGRHSGSP
jgi:hypothetical protein